MISVLVGNLASLASAILFQGAVPLSVDLLSPGDEGFAGIPSNLRCVDVFVNLNQDHEDVWTAAGLRAATVDLGRPRRNDNALLSYFGGDANNPHGGFVNPGYRNRFQTSICRPRSRDSVERFENAGAAGAGGYLPPSPTPTADPDLFNVAFFRSPPAQIGDLSEDGYIARVSVDISQVAAAGVDLTDYSNWNAGLLSEVPATATMVLISGPPPGQTTPGTAMFSIDDYWQGTWISWGLWYVPEPNGAELIVVVILCLGWIRRRSVF